MKLEEILEILESEAPLSLSDEYCKKFSEYDNSGILIDFAGDIGGVMFSLDFSNKALAEATKSGANLLVTHHPAIFKGMDSFLTSTDPQAQAIARCVRGRISVISMHLNLDVAADGIDASLMRGLGGEECKIMNQLSVENCGYGRFYKIKPVKLSALAEEAKKTFSSQRVITYGADKEIRKVASFCGAGCDEKSVRFAIEKNADLFVSSDLKHHLVAKLCENGVSVLQLTHYAAENYGFKKFAARMKKKINLPATIYTDKELL